MRPSEYNTHCFCSVQCMGRDACALSKIKPTEKKLTWSIKSKKNSHPTKYIATQQHINLQSVKSSSNDWI